MSKDTPPASTHRPGEASNDQPTVVPPAPPSVPPPPVAVDSWAGQIKVEWDPNAPLTPLGQLPFFIEYLKLAGLFDALVADCPLARTSPNAPLSVI